MKTWPFVLAAVGLVAISVPVDANCTLSVVSANFGIYAGALLNPGATPITVHCDANEQYDVGLTGGLGSGATVTTRKMTGPSGATLSYRLFRDAARTSVWGDTNNIDSLGGVGSGSDQTLRIYPQVGSGQYLTPGTYTDTVTVRVTGSGVATTILTIVAIVQGSCSIGSGNLDFGLYTGLQRDGVAVINVTCSSTTTYNLGLNTGSGAGATIVVRRMTGSANRTLNYQLFKDGGRNINWGDTIGANTLTGIGTGVTQAFVIYGRITGGQAVIPGSYADSIVATITY